MGSEAPALATPRNPEETRNHDAAPATLTGGINVLGVLLRYSSTCALPLRLNRPTWKNAKVLPFPLRDTKAGALI
jgi:hypothetical protein